MPAMMDDKGAYRPDSGDFDSKENAPKGSLVIDPKTVRGLEGYQPGDTVNLTLKVRYMEPNEEGMSDLEIISASAEEMDESMAMSRHREKMGTY